ncbi:MAG: OmpA family protein [Puniceicoccales bacterium]|jgi:outer membrane protein OmpA-like peptidoglycan-associated protein|nr:OmpA family protein [Puniceicoccales bacterium]
MLNRYVRNLCILGLIFTIAGCSSFDFSTNESLSPQDTIVTEKNCSDECFINKDDGKGDNFVAHGFDTQKTEYNYTSADVLEAVYFNFDSSKILQAELIKITEIAKVFIKDKTLCVLIVGNCDKFGKESYNDVLGKQRAEAVRDVFVFLGIDENRIITASLGSMKANKSVQHKEDSVLDRRCDIVIHAMQ